ncbi:nardilysin-like [Polyodon spathula]|uniref:nardilysin-like n=1 Tax=Polyodon spathula TaxID=7913 RepID=UPI001B7EF271|nr:nardilysin-like [Polyodon spathula]
MLVTNKYMGTCAESAQPSQPEPKDDPVQPPAQAKDEGASGDGGGGESPGDSEIVKSPSDPKHYRCIKLDNGVQALLISDMSSTEWKLLDSEEEEGDSEEDGSGEEDVAEEDGDSGEGTEEESEHGRDEQDSDFEELEDESDVKEKSCFEKQSAAALCIGVGSFSDPDDLPGLAHFLEHMVFMGSEKYPAENGFDAFLKKHGGSDNASTDCERTVFQFDVLRKYFREALDRWAQFFISPLMIKDAISREVEAVDSEYQLARPSDSHRKEMLFGSLAKPGHTMGKFCWGNTQTLKHEPKEKNIDTYARLREFWEQHYSAHYMTLAVQSKETLDTLEEWMREIFSKIPNKTWTSPDLFAAFVFQLYLSKRFISSLSPGHSFPRNIITGSSRCTSWLIGHEGTGSILSLLRKKCWALALYGGNSETGFDQNSTYSIFSISITLTDEGYRNYYQIADLVFQYLKMLQKSGFCREIEKEWSERWSGDFELNPDLHLPAENKFIATDFILKTSDCPDTEYPVRIVNSEKGCLWYKKDNKFKIPKAYIRFNLISPVIQKSPENLVLFDIFVNIVAHNLAEPAYEADVAQLEYKLVAGQHGFVIKVKGFSHKLPLLFNLIIDYLADFTAAPDVFSVIAEQLKKTYFNILIKPDKLGKDARLLILEHSRWSIIQKYQAIMKGLNMESLMSFVSKLKSQLYAEGMVQGNFTSREAMEFLHSVIQKLQFQRLSVEVPVHFRVVELPKVPHLCKVKSLNKGDANSEVTVYYQSGPRNLREHTLMGLLVMHVEEPCFDFLRTKETLGYHVYPTCRNTSGVLGFSVTVETQATKFNTEEVDIKIEEFLTIFGEKMASITDEAFKGQVVALIKLKECEDTHLGEEVDRNWYEVVTQQYVFDRLNCEIEALRLIIKSELVSWFMEHRGAGSKKLSMHMSTPQHGRGQEARGEGVLLFRVRINQDYSIQVFSSLHCTVKNMQ